MLLEAFWVLRVCASACSTEWADDVAGLAGPGSKTGRQHASVTLMPHSQHRIPFAVLMHVNLAQQCLPVPHATAPLCVNPACKEHMLTGPCHAGTRAAAQQWVTFCPYWQSWTQPTSAASCALSPAPLLSLQEAWQLCSPGNGIVASQIAPHSFCVMSRFQMAAD